MSNSPTTLTCEIDLLPGESLALPATVTEKLSAGRWRIIIQPISDTTTESTLTRDHSAFLDSYSPEDEGLYDDYTR